ncbi:MAG: hypothetical protein IKL29_06185 [Bacteroidaceae bacterium]|nr:hypothetical protein [Bacteroidaceae bacterium]
MTPKGTKTIFHKKWNHKVPFFYYSFRANRRAIGHAKCRKVASRGWRLPQATIGWFNYREAMIEAIV